MAGKSATLKNDYIKLFFNTTATGIPGVATNAGSPLTSFWASLHTGVPGTAAGSQLTNEATYTGYQRVEVLRTTAGFAVSANSVTFAANVTFATASSSGQTITHFGIGSTATGSGYLFYAGTCTPTVTIDMGIIPILTTGTRITED